MFFVTLENGCMVCLSHLTNQDGYLRKSWGSSRKAGRVLEMFHRFIFRAHKGEIPEDYEVDHLCKNRACANPDHLQAIPGDVHAVETNRNRYHGRKTQAYEYWKENRPTGVSLAEAFGVSFSSACEWIRQWKKESLDAPGQ